MKSHFEGKPDTRLYSIMPARAIQDDRLHQTTLRVLGALCLHANAHGVGWPSRTTIGRHISRTPLAITRHTKRLEAYGYIRKLSHRTYPVPKRGQGIVNRWQILYELTAPLPTKEQFYSPKPKVIQELDDDVAVPDKSQGVRGIDAELHKRIARAFAAGVERATGQPRDLAAQLPEAERLAAAGVTPEQVTDVTVAMCQERLAAGKSAPITLKQVAAWSGLA